MIEVRACAQFLRVEKRFFRLSQFQEKLNERDINLITVLNVSGAVAFLGNLRSSLLDDVYCVLISTDRVDELPLRFK